MIKNCLISGTLLFFIITCGRIVPAFASPYGNGPLDDWYGYVYGIKTLGANEGGVDDVNGDNNITYGSVTVSGSHAVFVGGGINIDDQSTGSIGNVLVDFTAGDDQSMPDGDNGTNGANGTNGGVNGVIPEPVSTLLFITGGLTFGLKRLRQKLLDIV